MNLDNLTWLFLGAASVLGILVAVAVLMVVDAVTRLR